MNILMHVREPFNAWSHGLWLFVSIPATILLWRRSRGDRGKQLSLLIYGLSMAFCFSASSSFHGVIGSPGRIQAFALLDYIGIYALIAGTYTAITWNLLGERWRSTLLELV